MKRPKLSRDTLMAIGRELDREMPPDYRNETVSQKLIEAFQKLYGKENRTPYHH